MTMARNQRDLQQLIDELAGLSPEDRDRVLQGVARRERLRPLPKDFRPPLFPRSGAKWIGGSLRREEMYGDDER
jgi:hypothetical protein